MEKFVQNTMDRTKNECISDKRNLARHFLETLATISKLKYFTHITFMSHSMEKDWMLRLKDGSRRRENQRKRWTDKIRGTVMMNCCTMQNRAGGRDMIYKAMENRK
jgi:hypothetical protein